MDNTFLFFISFCLYSLLVIMLGKLVSCALIYFISSFIWRSLFMHRFSSLISFAIHIYSYIHLQNKRKKNFFFKEKFINFAGIVLLVLKQEKTNLLFNRKLHTSFNMPFVDRMNKGEILKMKSPASTFIGGNLKTLSHKCSWKSIIA